MGDAALEAIERAMIRIRRSVTRRELGRRMAELLGDAGDLSQFFALDAVEETGSGVTVGAVAERLGVDPSRASRLVAAAVRSGYLVRVASQADARQILLELTDAGREMVNTMHAHRQAEFDRAMRGWSEEERAEFARLLARFTNEEERTGDSESPAGS